MNVTDIVAEFGAVYQDSGQNAKDLAKKIYFKTETDALFSPVNTDDTVIRKGSSTMSRLLQPFQKTWTPIGGVTFNASTIELYPMKVDFDDYPDELEGTWLGFLASSDLDRKQWPFVKWLIEEHILNKMAEDYELNEVYKGVFAAPTPGTAGAISTAMNGVKKIINLGVAGGDITPIVTGAISTDPVTFVEQVEAFMAGVPAPYQDLLMKLGMSKVLARRFADGNRLKYNMNYAQITEMNTVDGYNTSIVGVNSMVGSSKIFCTPNGNGIVATKKNQNIKTVRVESVKRQISIYTDFYKGVGFVVPSLVFTNDVELT